MLIAHRGLLYGPSQYLENTPEQIEKALHLAFHVEVDIWYHKKGQSNENLWYLGHDGPDTQVDIKWLRSLPLDRVWFHAKSIPTLCKLSQETWPVHYFAHENDPVVITNSGYLWTYPGKQLTEQSIMVLPEIEGMSHIEMYARTVQGICSDYVVDIYNKLKR
jgi:hypothetical protein